MVFKHFQTNALHNCNVGGLGMCFCRFGHVLGCFKNGFALDGRDNHLVMLLKCLYLIMMKMQSNKKVL